MIFFLRVVLTRVISLPEYTKTCSTLGVELEDAVSGADRLKIASLSAFGAMVAAVLLSVV